MINIRNINKTDKTFWFKLDEHLSEEEFENKIKNKTGYIILDNNITIGILRYNLFWDNTPFCTMIYIDSKHQSKGYGKKLIAHWEGEMKKLGYGMIMTSTRVDEEAQHFYRKLGFHDAGCLLIDIPKYKQPMEIFFIKEI
ncbi:GNAT family N-acetyltransferase [Miniphocaeibacter massiliensis]|uniref:GNAT family N-acetyltransferase n=1 Tax=Miniphocaeibacter massiliensis TaxID=2041841 RepID=UPI000C1BD280|nr:GNAT family N-acetyltransferase [Miniphocaeibacter massiliensis]